MLRRLPGKTSHRCADGTRETPMNPGSIDDRQCREILTVLVKL